MHYYNKNWICDYFIDTMFLFETQVPDTTTHNKNVSIKTTGKHAWGECMIRGLTDSKYKYIILIHEDYFLTEKQDVLQMKKLLKIAEDNDMNLLKICGEWSGWTGAEKIHIGEISDKEKIYEYSKVGPYITSHQMSIWNREYLLKTIVAGENPWQHEVIGHCRAQKIPGKIFTYVAPQPMPYAECVTAGGYRAGNEKWFEVDLK